MTCEICEEFRERASELRTEVEMLETDLRAARAYTERLLVIIQKHNADCDFHHMPKWKIALATVEGEGRQ
jgi:hypothetical protein